MPSLAPVSAKILAVATYLPERMLTNEQLASVFQDWSAEKILQKTGIRTRHVAAPDETATDMGVAAAERLFADHSISREDVDYLIFCTQAADYVLPTSACVIQDRLSLPKSIGALDITLGCSGYVYGLSLAVGLIAGGMAKNILLVTADTYSKFINDRDRSVRTLFGDGATASLVSECSSSEGSSIGHFVFGTDGSGAKDLIVKTGGARVPRTPLSSIEIVDDAGNFRSDDNLYMNGGAVMNFTLREVPKMFNEIKLKSNYGNDDFDYVVLHQANLFMLETLRKKIGVPIDQVPYHFEGIGNTVSSTIPFVLAKLLKEDQNLGGKKAALLGFGVGLSWAGCVIEF